MHPSQALATVCLLAAASAQTPSAWATLPVPGGVIAANLQSQGKIVVHRGAATLDVFSAVTRNFTPIPASPTATVRLHNDCLLVVDGSTWLAFSAYTGMAVPLPVTGSATYRNGAGAVNDSVLLVADGNQLHAFSAFTGTWTTRTVSAAFAVAGQRHVAILADGPLLAGYDAFTATWTDLALPTPLNQPTLSADGSAAFATSGTTVHAFSSWQRNWRRQVVPPGSTFARGDDFGVWLGGQSSCGYSSIRGEFRAHGPRAIGLPTVFDNFVLFDSSSGIAAFSSFTGRFREALAQPGATVTGSESVALLEDSAGTHGYSPVQDRAVLHPALGQARGASNVVAWGTDPGSGRPVFFSALTAQFHPAPGNAAAQDPALTTVAGACLVPGGCVAFSARSGRFVPLVEPAVQFVTSGASAPLLVFGQNLLHAFDARTESWVSTQRVGVGSPQPQIWRTAALVLDGTTAHSFGAFTGTWSSQPLPGPVLGSRANSEGLRVHTANHLFAASAVPSTPWLAQFPEFRRVQPASADLVHWIALPPGAIALAGYGAVVTANTPIAGFGDLWLAPAGLTASLVAGTGPLPIRTSLPAQVATAFLGLELGLQIAVLPATGFPWLGELASVRPL
ncbi:MAG: hypothetical protein JNK15_17345 [Planctomycetes bacterium]|nr:hypothetical protein [Planctomycetota bacterium]